ncbi:hypothetical protein QE152_g38810 [Popillia japonica]|uniref:Ig-like domain-containing protein n=1 Tax=Popillia japonica TaxID=7064 RepID=A0AAW1HWD0_POPJA
MPDVPPHITPFDFGSDAKNAGESTSLYCTVDKGDHPVQLEWFFNGKPIYEISEVFVTQVGRKSSVLNIESIHAEHTGGYTCKATNWAGSAYYTARLEVNVPPQILHFDFGNDIVNSGEMAIVNCAVTRGDFPITISWTLHNETINHLEGISITNTNKRVSQLAIDSVNAQHAGEYTCHAKNLAGSTEYSAILRVNVAPQVLPFEFGAEEMNSGDTVSVACSVYKGDLPLHITWLLNNKPALDYQGITVNLVNKKLSTLTIDSVDAIHAGQYTCLAKNSAGESSFTKNLTVNVPPQILPFEFGEEQFNTGDMVSATCTVNKGDLPIMISWSLNGQPLPNSEGISINLISRRASYLSIDHITAEHSGQFVCHAKNLAGETQYSATLRVNVAPHITPFEFEGQSNTGDSVQLTCYVSKGDVPLNISWKLNGVKLTPDDGVSIIPIGGRTSLLTIPAVQPRNAGEYTCYASNVAGSAVHAATLYINGMIGAVYALLAVVQPSISPFEFGAEAVNSGEMVSVLCTVNRGDLPINVTWNLNGRTVGSYRGISVLRTNNRISQLSIDSVRAEHAGTYECVSGNSAGIAKHSAYLRVNVQPQITPFEFGEEAVDSGDMASVSCMVHKGDFPISIDWFLNNQSVSEHHGISILRTNKRISQLSIDSVQAEHNGVYECVASNSAGVARHSAQVLPKLLPFNFGDEAAHLGESTTVQCSLALGDLPVNFTWFLNNENVNANYGVNIGMFGKKTSVLSIESLDAQHAGNYTCIARNAAGSSSHSSELKVMAIPKIIPFSFGEAPSNLGDSASIQCGISSGDLPMRFSWFLNGETIGQDEGINIGSFGKKTSVLSIDSLAEHHAGNYSCVAQNKAGIESYSAELIVIG